MIIFFFQNCVEKIKQTYYKYFHINVHVQGPYMPILKSNSLIRAVHQPLGAFQFAMCTHVQPLIMKTRVFHFFTSDLVLLWGYFQTKSCLGAKKFGCKTVLNSCLGYKRQNKTEKKITTTTNVLWARVTQIFRFGFLFFFFFFQFFQNLVKIAVFGQKSKNFGENF